jgi:hypothetical protein
MTNEQISTEIIKFAKEYQKNLENRNVMFVFMNRDNSINLMETVNHPRNYLHLTGVDIKKENVSGAVDFYNLAVKGKLETSHFIIRDRKNVENKLEAFKQTMAIHKTGKEIGDFYGTGGKLHTDKLSGNVFACLGYSLDDTMYVPNTNLKENVRFFTAKPCPILVTLRKDIAEEKYTEITHIKKGLDLSELKLPPEILAKLTDEAKTQLNQEVSPAEKETSPPPIAPALTAGDFIVERHIGQTFTVSGGAEPDKSTPALKKST